MVLLTPLVACVAAIIPPNPIHDAAAYTTLVNRSAHGVHYRVSAPDALPFSVVHLFGSAEQRGEAHGHLLSEQLLNFVDTQMNDFFRQYVSSINLSGLPAWLQAAIRKLLPSAAKAAPAIFELALGWLEGEQRKYNNASAARIYDEMAGIARGACAAARARGRACDEAKLYSNVLRLNVLPDLIKMQCSMLGASRSATRGGHLVQMRALDFGGGPFANNSVLLIHHPATAAVKTSHPFAALSFPGFAGIVTGFTPSIAISEKVNDIHGGGTPAGSYDGQTTVSVIRDMLELSDTRVGAHATAQRATRTWGVWLGVGEAADSSFGAIEYMRASADMYDATTLPTLTGQPALRDVAYIDKHPQPSPDRVMHDAIAPLLPGNVTAATVAQTLPRLTQSGDVHIYVYDFAPGREAVLVSLGRTSRNGTYVGPGGRPAWAAPFVRFPTASLWSEPPPPPGKHAGKSVAVEEEA